MSFMCLASVNTCTDWKITNAPWKQNYREARFTWRHHICKTTLQLYEWVEQRRLESTNWFAAVAKEPVKPAGTPQATPCVCLLVRFPDPFADGLAWGTWLPVCLLVNDTLIASTATSPPVYSLTQIWNPKNDPDKTYNLPMIFPIFSASLVTDVCVK